MVTELFTIQSLISLQGAAALALLVPNVLGYLIGKKFDKSRKWVSFVVSAGLAFLAPFVWTGKIGLIDGIVAFCNVFLIFASAVGINQMLQKESLPEKKMAGKKIKTFAVELTPKKKFFSNWFRI